MKTCSAVLLLTLFGAVAGFDITPNLRPKSDEKFMKDDYPSDERPAVVARFDHPYPAVQDSEDYDKDYTKDENDDNGEWRAQTEYDMLKNKLAKELQDVREAMAKEREERLEYEAAVKAQEEAEKLAKTQEQKALDATNAEPPEDPADKRWGIRAAIKKVEDETSDLERCKKELEEARKKLAAAQAKQATAEEAHAKEEAQHAAKKKTEIDAEKQEATLEKTVDEEEKEYLLAKKDYDEEKAELDAAEDKLAKAEKRLREYRSDVDHKGGVYRKKEPVKASARAGAGVSAVLLLVTLFAAN